MKSYNTLAQVLYKVPEVTLSGSKDEVVAHANITWVQFLKYLIIK